MIEKYHHNFAYCLYVFRSVSNQVRCSVFIHEPLNYKCQFLFQNARHAWETVTQAVWRKYPNDFNPHVKAIDTLDRHVDKEGRLITKRLMGTQWSLPSFAIYILGLQDMCYGIEHSIVDPRAKTMTLKGRNLTFSGFVGIEENLVYSQHPEDKNL